MHAPVALAASVNPIAPWVDAFNETSTNATAVLDTFFNAPAPVLQQFLVDQINYLNQVLNDPLSVVTAMSAVVENLDNAFRAATFIGAQWDPDDISTLLQLAQSTDLDHGSFAIFLPAVLSALLNLDDFGSAIATELTHFMASPLSGVIMGLTGPFISPVVALVNSINAIVGADNPAEALQAIVAMPANVVGAFFNGATLQLDPLIPLISGLLPPEAEIDALSIAFGGLFTPGATTVGLTSAWRACLASAVP